jgi:hypothetical protein
VFGGAPFGTTTTGFFDSGDGGFGVVAVAVAVVGVGVVGVAADTAAAVAPDDGAGSTPGAVEELPQAARPAASRARSDAPSVCLIIGGREGSAPGVEAFTERPGPSAGDPL